MPKIYTLMFWTSLSLALISLILTFTFGLRLGVDFTGGSVLELQFSQPPAMEEIRNVLASQIADPELNPTGNGGVIIKTHELTEAQHQAVLTTLNAAFPKAGLQEEKFDSVGPVIGNELKRRSITAIVVVLLAVITYIAFVFRKLGRTTSPWAMGLSAIVALFHDIVIPVGVFAVLGHYFNISISAVFLAAALTILGYSVSDSVVIFDRVRENILRSSFKGDIGAVVHRSILQTLARSLNTVMTTLISLFAIFIFGGESIKYFALALIIGIFLGAYSSIFVASPLLVWWTQKRKA